MDPSGQETFVGKVRWLWILLNFLTFVVIAFVGTRFIRDEPYRSLWVLASGLIVLAIWFFVGRSRR
jgi:cell division protein FtsW (lipid II flippase)